MKKKTCKRCGRLVLVKRGGAESHPCPHFNRCETIKKNTLACVRCDRRRKKEKADATPRV